MFKYFKKLAQHIFVYGLGDAINKVITIVIVPIFTRFLTPADYGVVAILTVTNSLIIGITDLGLSNGLFRYFWEEKPEGQKKLVSTAQIAMVVTPLLVALLAIPLAGQISQALFKTAEYAYLIKINFLAVALGMFITAPMERIRLEEKAKLYSLINIAKVITGLGLNFVLIIFLKRGVAGIFEGQLINAIFYALLIGAYSLRTNGFGFSFKLFRKMFSFGAPFVLALISFWVMDWADRFILTRLTSLDETGLYNLGYSMGMAIMLPVGAFSTAWSPFYMSVHKEKNALEIYSLSFTYYSLVMGFVVLAIAIFSRDYFYFFTPEIYHSAWIVVPLITLAYALKGNFLIAAVGAFLQKKPMLEVITEIVAMVVNIAAMFILIPYLGRMGAAWATIAAYLVLPVMMYLISFKIFPIKYEYGRILKIVLIGISLYALAKFVYEPTIANLFMRLGIVLLYPVLFFVTGFFKKDELARLKNLPLRFSRKTIVYEPTN